MNKIIVNKSSYCLNNEEILLNYFQNDLELNIMGRVVINDFNNNTDINLKINLNDNSELIYNRFNKNLANNKFFLIADSPDTIKHTAETKFWNQLYKNESLFKLIPSNEVAMVAEVIETSNAQKFL